MTIEATTWLYVTIVKTGPSEEIVGQTDTENDISFIPAFLDKEEAQRSYHFLVRDEKKKDEFQAIIYEDLAQHARDNGFLIFILNASGKILEKIEP